MQAYGAWGHRSINVHGAALKRVAGQQAVIARAACTIIYTDLFAGVSVCVGVVWCVCMCSRCVFVFSSLYLLSVPFVAMRPCAKIYYSFTECARAIQQDTALQKARSMYCSYPPRTLDQQGARVLIT